MKSVAADGSPLHLRATGNRADSRRLRQGRGFTLIELLIVIAVISVLAALIFPVTAAVNRTKIRSKARAELKQIETAIENYKTALGHYPPDHVVDLGGGRLDCSTNQLYYELLGTQPNPLQGPPTSYNTLANDSLITTNTINAVFGPGVGGFANCTRGGGDEGRPAKNFLAPQLSPAQVVTNASTGTTKFIACSIPSPQTATKPPVCYNSSNPAHNKNSFDLWIDVMVGNQVNRICNWSDKPLIGVTTYP